MIWNSLHPQLRSMPSTLRSYTQTPLQPSSIPELSSSFVSVITCQHQRTALCGRNIDSSSSVMWHGVAASCKKHFSCLLITVCLSWPVCGSASHREVVHTPVIRRLQRLALDIVCHDCNWCVCMQVDWYAGSMSHSLVDSCVCVIIRDDMIPQESATQQAWWAVFNDDPIANIMAQMIK